MKDEFRAMTKSDEPTKYGLSNLPTHTSLERLVWLAKLRWLIERDYRELKQELTTSTRSRSLKITVRPEGAYD